MNDLWKHMCGRNLIAIIWVMRIRKEWMFNLCHHRNYMSKQKILKINDNVMTGNHVQYVVLVNNLCSNDIAISVTRCESVWDRLSMYSCCQVNNTLLSSSSLSDLHFTLKTTQAEAQHTVSTHDLLRLYQFKTSFFLKKSGVLFTAATHARYRYINQQLCYREEV